MAIRGDDPTLRREWAETRLLQLKRNGRSEMDIFEEGLDMYLKILQESERAGWPRIVNNGVARGEFREAIPPVVQQDQGLSTADGGGCGS